MAKPKPVRLALDQNFPTPILAALSDFVLDVELVPLRNIDPRLSTLDDRQLIVALHQLGFSWPRHQQLQDAEEPEGAGGDHRHEADGVRHRGRW